MDRDFSNNLLRLFKFHCCLNNGICERGGYYVPIDDALSNDFITNRKHYKEGEEFSDNKQWIRVPEEIF